MDSAILDKYELVSGLEVHAQLLTKSKAYSGDANEYGNLPNTNISIITLAHPGTLPKPNMHVFTYAIKLGLACDANITAYNYYDRKNYFYPDLPKGYQITQDKTPICVGGGIRFKMRNNEERYIRLNRIHMEEDAGKSIHLEGETETLVDLNRAGVPLLEIVCEPDIRSSQEAYAYLTEIRKLVRYLEICDGNMEEGSLRCDANISVRLKGETKLGSKVEVKNMNSIRNVQRAIAHEFERQIRILEVGGTIISQTRTFNAQTGTTARMRMKEESNDYRYFPEPDLPPVVITNKYLESVRATMPSLPQALFKRFTHSYGLPIYDATVLTDEKGIALYFESLCEHTKNYKAASNWVMGTVKSYLNELTLDIAKFPLSPIVIADIIALVDSGKISFGIASQRLFPALIASPETGAQAMTEKLNLIQDSTKDFIQPFIEQTLAKYPDKVAAYKEGKKGVLGMFMGEIMRMAKGKANPKKANQMLIEMLEQ